MNTKIPLRISRISQQIAIFVMLLTACSSLIGEFEVGIETSQGSEPQVAVTESPEPVITGQASIGEEATPTELPGKGAVNGTVCYPGEFIPAMRVYFQETTSGEITELAIAENQASFSAELPPGTYIAYAYPDDAPIGGMYSEAVICGLGSDCVDHSPRPFVVRAGETNSEVSVCDWYAQEMLPSRPGSSGTVEHLPSLAGLVYHDLDHLWQVGMGGELKLLLDQPNGKVSPDGRRALLEIDGDIWIADLVAGGLHNLTNTTDRIETGAQWWPDRVDTIVFGSWGQNEDLGPSTGYLSVITVDGGGYRVLEDSASNADPAPSPDGQTIAYDLGGSAWLYRLDGGKEPFDVGEYGLEANKVTRIGSPAWSPDGKRLVWWVGGAFSEAGDYAIVLAVFDLETRAVHLLHPYTPLGGRGGWLPTPVWSPDGQWLALITLGERNKADLWIVRADGAEEHNLGLVGNPVWHPDSRFLAFYNYADEGIALVEVGAWELLSPDLPSNSYPMGWSDIVQERITDAEPSFSSHIYFATQPDMSRTQQVFPFGTPQIYALWSYANMRAGLNIRREWYLDGELWLVREVSWDFAKYGADGIIRDVSIYDFEQGLEDGQYQVKLFIDGREQTSSEDAMTRFAISKPNDVASLPSPDGAWTVVVQPPGTLILEDSNGARGTLLVTDEISSMGWFPDGRHLVYSNRDRSEQSLGAGTVGVLDSLWIVDVETGETHEIASKYDNLHDPLVSPDGQYIALVGGSSWFDACYVDRKLGILQMDEQLQVIYSYYQLDFADLPDAGSAYVNRLLEWETNSKLSVALEWTCTTEDWGGVYLLDLASRTGEKVGEIER